MDRQDGSMTAQHEELERLRKRVHELEAIEAGHKRLAQELCIRTGEFEQRVRELNCLLEISCLLEERQVSVDDVLQKTVDITSSSLGHPPGTGVRIVFSDKIFGTRSRLESSSRMVHDFVIDGKSMGLLEVRSRGQTPDSGERHLITAVGRLVERIIEQKLTERALQESERRFRSLVENSPTGIFIIQNGEVVYENPEETRLSGPLVRLFRKGDLSDIHPDDVDRVKDGFRSLITGRDRTFDMDFRFFVRRGEDGHPEMKWVHCRASLISYLGKEAMLINKLDVTRAKELEYLLRTDDKMASLGRVASGIAHEIRNPLSGINIYLSILEKVLNSGEGAGKTREILSEIRSASDRIESIIKRVMDFSKPSEPRPVYTDVNQPIRDAIRFSSVALRKKGIALDTRLAEDLPFCHADPHLVAQVILNLITNAVEAMTNHTIEKRIEVTSFVRDRRIVITVSDSGPGVPAHLRKKIFDPFYTTKEGNTGIGLGLSHRIVADHGGTLAVTDGRLGGAEFTIEMPIKNGSHRE